ncbi:hypothetical protein DSECCO2_298230 [anaerobic digester metagenome]
MKVIHKMQHLGLRTTRAVHHAVYLTMILIKYLFDNRGIGAGGGEDQFAHVDARHRRGLRKF